MRGFSGALFFLVALAAVLLVKKSPTLVRVLAHCVPRVARAALVALHTGPRSSLLVISLLPVVLVTQLTLRVTRASGIENDQKRRYMFLDPSSPMKGCEG